MGPNRDIGTMSTIASTRPNQARPLRTGEVAAALGISQQTVRRLIESGQLPGAFRVGHQYRVPAETVERIRSTPIPP